MEKQLSMLYEQKSELKNLVTAMQFVDEWNENHPNDPNKEYSGSVGYDPAFSITVYENQLKALEEYLHYVELRSYGRDEPKEAKR